MAGFQKELKVKNKVNVLRRSSWYLNSWPVRFHLFYPIRWAKVFFWSSNCLVSLNYIGTLSALSVTSSQQYIEIQIQIQTQIQILFSPNYAGTLSALSVTSSNLVLGKTDPLPLVTLAECCIAVFSVGIVFDGVFSSNSWNKSQVAQKWHKQG